MKGNNNYGYKKTQKQINLVAHDKVLVFENFRYLMESLEEYIEKVGCFPNFKRQFRNITIPKEKKYSVKNCENLFRTKLLIFLGVLSDDTPDDTRKEVKEEFWKWIDSVGIDANSCSDKKIKHFLVEVNNVIEGSSEKVFEQTKKRLDDKYKNNPPSWEGVMKVFGSIQNPLDKKRDQEGSYKDKNYFEVENENKIEGIKEKGEQVYNQLTGSISRDDFNFYSSKAANEDDGGFPLGDNSQNWKLDKIATKIEIGNFNRVKKEKFVVYHRNARLNDFNQEGKLNFNNNQIFKWNSFTVQQKFEIKNSLSENRAYLDKDYLTDDEISFVIKEFADNPSVWTIKMVEGHECLVHNSAQENNKHEIGTLIHERQKFSETEWKEINEVLELNRQYGVALGKLNHKIPLESGETRETLEIWAKHLEKKILINSIRRNSDKWEIKEEEINKTEVLIRKTAKINADEDYVFLKGELELINKSNQFYGKEFFDDKEWVEIELIFTAYENKQVLKEQFKLALSKRANWRDHDFENHGETREGLEKWIKELEVRRNINEWGNYSVNGNAALIHQSSLRKNSRGDLVITDPSRVYFKDKDLSADGWIRIEQEKSQSQHYNQAANQQVYFSQPTNSNKSFPKPLIFGAFALVILLVGAIVYKVRKNKVKR